MKIMDVGKMKAFRTSKGFSQEELALKASLSANFIGNIERGKENITLDSLGKIAQALDVAPGALIKSKIEVDANDFIWSEDLDKYKKFQQIVYMLETFDEIEITTIYLIIKLVFDSKVGTKDWLN